jgi:PAS domain S-box-containing protein
MFHPGISDAERQAILEDYFENANVGLHVVGPDGTILAASRAELEFLGYADAPDEYIGHHIAEFHADRDVIEAMLATLLANVPLVDHPARLVARDGSIKAVRIHSSSRFAGGRFVNTRCLTLPDPDASTDAVLPRAAHFDFPSFV